MLRTCVAVVLPGPQAPVLAGAVEVVAMEKLHSHRSSMQFLHAVSVRKRMQDLQQSHQLP